MWAFVIRRGWNPHLSPNSRSHSCTSAWNARRSAFILWVGASPRVCMAHACKHVHMRMCCGTHIVGEWDVRNCGRQEMKFLAGPQQFSTRWLRFQSILLHPAYCTWLTRGYTFGYIWMSLHYSCCCYRERRCSPYSWISLTKGVHVICEYIRRTANVAIRHFTSACGIIHNNTRTVNSWLLIFRCRHTWMSRYNYDN